MTNIELFQYSGQHKEQLLDPYYISNTIPVIPPTRSETNELVEKNTRLIKLISVFAYFMEKGKRKNHPEVVKLINEVIDILMNTANINLSPFSSFFMVYDSSYAAFRNYETNDKYNFIYKILQNYCKKRHVMYLSHRYTNSMLQVVDDNYSHKRKSKAGIRKVCAMLHKLGFAHDCTERESGSFYFLPDAGDKEAFIALQTKYNIIKKTTKKKQGKLPDMVLFNDGNYYVVELKHINGSGGGQDKQLSEVIDFIECSGKGGHIHFISYMDGGYSNLLHGAKKREKVKKQYKAILSNLKTNPGNYFVNTAGLKELLRQLISE